MAGLLLSLLFFLLRMEGFRIRQQLVASASLRILHRRVRLGIKLAAGVVRACCCGRRSLCCHARWARARRRMAIMAGMLPGVERARRRRLRLRKGESSSSSGAAAEARRASSCLYGGEHHDRARLLGSSSAPKWGTRSSACEGTGTARARAVGLDGNAREAKERLDQKLRGQRESVAKSNRHHQSADGGGGGGGGSSLHHPCLLRREVFSEAQPPKEGRGGAARRRFGWLRLRLGRCRRAEAEAACEEECAVCLEELRAGDVVARLPCAHRFHWSCAVPWVRAASRCPVCRARAHLAAASSPEL